MFAPLFCRSIVRDWTTHENDSSHLFEIWRILVYRCFSFSKPRHLPEVLETSHAGTFTHKRRFHCRPLCKIRHSRCSACLETLEVTSFGTLSKLFCNLSDNALKKAIAREFCLPQHKIFESWIKSAVALRNCLAHHSRVWNRVYPIKPQIPTKLKGKWISIAVPQANKLYPQLCYLQYIQNIMCPGNDFGSQLKILLKQHPNIDVAAMGFPANWQNEPLWKQL